MKALEVRLFLLGRLHGSEKSPSKSRLLVACGDYRDVVAAFDAQTLEAVGDLLALGEQEGFGISFTPDQQGWTIGYLRSMGGGDLLTGFDLGDTARAAVRPLLDLSARYAAARVERDREKAEYDAENGSE